MVRNFSTPNRGLGLKSTLKTKTNVLVSNNFLDALLVLDLCLDGVDGVGGLDFEGDGLAGEGLNENLHRVY